MTAEEAAQEFSNRHVHLKGSVKGQFAGPVTSPHLCRVHNRAQVGGVGDHHGPASKTKIFCHATCCIQLSSVRIWIESSVKKTAYLINAARGPIVDTTALIEALQRGEIAGAALDTIEGEAGIFGVDRSQSGVDNTNLETLKALPNVEISPHIGFYTVAAVKNMIDISLDDVKTILVGGHSPHQVN